MAKTMSLLCQQLTYVCPLLPDQELLTHCCLSMQELPSRPWSRMSTAPLSPSCLCGPREGIPPTPTPPLPGTATVLSTLDFPGGKGPARETGRQTSPSQEASHVGQVGQALHKAASGMVMVGLFHSPLGNKSSAWGGGGEACRNSIGAARGVLGAALTNSRPPAAQPHKGSSVPNE
jgi:hypothetical protein